MSATIRDVAQRAGVGLGTVSQILNSSSLVSAATQQRVLDILLELHCSSGLVTCSLSISKTLTVATIEPFFTRSSVVERLRDIEAILLALLAILNQYAGYCQVLIEVDISIMRKGRHLAPALLALETPLVLMA